MYEVTNKKDFLMEKLVEKTKELGRRVTFSEMKHDRSMPDPNRYPYYWKTFDEASEEALRKAGLKTDNSDSGKGKCRMRVKKLVEPVKVESEEPDPADEPEAVEPAKTETLADELTESVPEAPSSEELAEPDSASETSLDEPVEPVPVPEVHSSEEAIEPEPVPEEPPLEELVGSDLSQEASLVDVPDRVGSLRKASSDGPTSASAPVSSERAITKLCSNSRGLARALNCGSICLLDVKLEVHEYEGERNLLVKKIE